LFLTKMVLLKVVHPLKICQFFKFSWYHVEWCKFCIHLRSLNVRHCLMVEGTGLKSMHQGRLQWHDLPTEFHKNLPIGSKVIRGDTQTDRQTGDLISLTFLFKERRQKYGVTVYT
jgi:hypothetical protein